MNKIESAHDVFWLARYAHNTLDPLFKAARQYEPSLYLVMQMNFSGATLTENSVSVFGHWDRDRMFLYAPTLRTTAGVDKAAAKVQKFIDTEQAKLEAAHDAAVSYFISTVKTGIAA